jgi:hypothetical protein
MLFKSRRVGESDAFDPPYRHAPTALLLLIAYDMQSRRGEILHPVVSIVMADAAGALHRQTEPDRIIPIAGFSLWRVITGAIFGEF